MRANVSRAEFMAAVSLARDSSRDAWRESHVSNSKDSPSRSRGEGGTSRRRVWTHLNVAKVGSCPAVRRRPKADRTTAEEQARRTATYRGELRSCFTGWLPLFKIIPFARSWDYICLSDQASGNHLGTNARPPARCESCLSPAFPTVRLSFPLACSSAAGASSPPSSKHTWKIRVVSATPSPGDFRRPAAA